MVGEADAAKDAIRKDPIRFPPRALFAIHPCRWGLFC